MRNLRNLRDKIKQKEIYWCTENRADFFSFTGKHLVIMMEKRKFAD